MPTRFRRSGFTLVELPVVSKSKREAFTLVELLVVIGIIAVLISILFPTLSRARRQSNALVCRSNLRQLTIAFFSYGVDFHVMPSSGQSGAVNLDWGGMANVAYTANKFHYRHPFETSPIYRYLKNTSILICPTSQLPNKYYDYTFVRRMAGAKPTLHWRVSYPSDPAHNKTSPRLFFPGMPLVVEEHVKFYNVNNVDGSFSTLDQFTIVHEGGGNIGYLDGSVAMFYPPHGRRDEKEEPEDLVADYLKVHTGGGLFNIGGAGGLEDTFGWVNEPH